MQAPIVAVIPSVVELQIEQRVPIGGNFGGGISNSGQRPKLKLQFLLLNESIDFVTVIGVGLGVGVSGVFFNRKP